MQPQYTPAEVWRTIPGHNEIYQVSDLGRVRTRKCIVSFPDKRGFVRTRPVKEHIKSVAVARGGYKIVNLSCHQGNRTVHVHVLVAEAFLGAKPPAHEIHHINGDRLDNRAINLEYTRVSDHRSLHSRETATRKRLTSEQINRITDDLASGHMTQRAIAKVHETSQSTVSKIKLGKYGSS